MRKTVSLESTLGLLLTKSEITEREKGGRGAALFALIVC